MNWQQTILYNLNNLGAKRLIIQDKTGILLRTEFASFLSTSDIQYCICIIPEHLLENKFIDNEIVIIPDIEIPSFIAEKSTIQEFDFRHLPLHIDAELAKTLDTDDLIALLYFQNTEKSIKNINEYNITECVHEAQVSFKKSELAQLKHKIYAISADKACDYDQVLLIGELWGQYVHQCWKVGVKPSDSLKEQIDDTTFPFVKGSDWQNIFHLTVNNFKSVDRIRDYIKQKGYNKTALICFDGMGIAEWELLKEYLSPLNLEYQQRNIFSLIPSTTLVSRSAIYSGYEEPYKDKTLNEEKQLQKFFAERNIAFYREGDIHDSEKLLGLDFVSIVYLVFDKLGHATNFPHGETTKDLYFENVSKYLEKSSILNELKILAEDGFSIFLCSDHGCVVASGNGQKLEKYLIEKNCKRAGIAKDSSLIENLDIEKMQVPFIDNKVVLLAEKRTIFTSKKLTEISHGGITVDEIVIPFIEVIS
ncbi:MAG: PglZ domain-containing protein [Deltaproteobacteria bacterium]|nr:PglZ domain-containing protein [Deltaproteobacteria bacterium]